MSRREAARQMMTRGEVRMIDYRRGSSTQAALVSVESTSDHAYDTAANVARGAAQALGIGGCVTEVPGAIFEVWHNGEHIMDVMSS